jgi:hypothetical protein
MKTAGSYFLRYLIMGLTGLAALILGSKIFEFSSVLITASGIILTTLIAVGLYTLVVLREDALLLEPDAPDLAYYLGFSLTVAALALTFLADLMIAQGGGTPGDIASAKSQVVNRALSQFGAGLLATLFGLCAKILLSSKQATRAQDPTALANKFRLELAEFSRLIDSTSHELAFSVRTGCNAINGASKEASESIVSLSKQISNASEVLARSFTPELISTPIAAFLKEMEGLTSPLAGLKTGVEQLNIQLGQVRTSVTAYDEAIVDATASIASHSGLLVQGTSDTKAFSRSMASVNKQAVSLEASFVALTSSLATSVAPAAGLSQLLEATGGSASQLTRVTNTLSEALSSSNQVVQSSSEQFERLMTTTQSVEATMRGVDGVAKGANSTLEGSQEAIAGLTLAVATALQSFNEVSSASEGLIESIRANAQAHKASGEGASAIATTFATLNSALSQLSAELKGVGALLEQTQAATSALHTHLGPFAETLRQTEPSVQGLDRSLTSTAKTLDTVNASAGELATRLGTLAPPATRV